jgi:hypothetical protein
MTHVTGAQKFPGEPKPSGAGGEAAAMPHIFAIITFVGFERRHSAHLPRTCTPRRTPPRSSLTTTSLLGACA